MTYEVEPR